MKTPGARTKGKKPKRKVIIVTGATDVTGPLVTARRSGATSVVAPGSQARAKKKKLKARKRMVARA